MLYPYMTLADETEISHTQQLDKNGVLCVEVHFERPTDSGFDTARCELPSYTWLTRTGFSDDEIKKFEEFLRYNAHLIFRFANEGGISCA